MTSGRTPFVATGDAFMIDEQIGETVGAQPRFQRTRVRIVLTRMANEKNGYHP
jgi:hypothetical protein